jgi:hypothetical protein
VTTRLCPASRDAPPPFPIMGLHTKAGGGLEMGDGDLDTGRGWEGRAEGRGMQRNWQKPQLQASPSAPPPPLNPALDAHAYYFLATSFSCKAYPGSQHRSHTWATCSSSSLDRTRPEHFSLHSRRNTFVARETGNGRVPGNALFFLHRTDCRCRTTDPFAIWIDMFEQGPIIALSSIAGVARWEGGKGR